MMIGMRHFYSSLFFKLKIKQKKQQTSLRLGTTKLCVESLY